MGGGIPGISTDIIDLRWPLHPLAGLDVRQHPRQPPALTSLPTGGPQAVEMMDTINARGERWLHAKPPVSSVSPQEDTVNHSFKFPETGDNCWFWPGSEMCPEHQAQRLLGSAVI